jgi:hypothetical protein
MEPNINNKNTITSNSNNSNFKYPKINNKITITDEEEVNQFDSIYFPEWNKLKYFALKKREIYPNLFFYYFNFNGIITKNLSKDDKKKLISFLTNSNSSKIKYNGLWGFVSLYFENKNGIEIFNSISKLEIFNSGISIPCIQDGKPYDEKTKV